MNEGKQELKYKLLLVHATIYVKHIITSKYDAAKIPRYKEQT
jgi:hypothetical protein